ncbi:carbohydrate ABC transporter permease [Candidatus Riflebacteria bacterium]
MSFSNRSLIIITLVLSFFSFLSLLPLLIMFLTSFTEAGQLDLSPFAFFYSPWSWKNYAFLLRTTPIIQWFLNSLLLAFVVTFFHLWLDTLAGYCLAHGELPYKNLFFWLILLTMMIPGQVLMVPLYILMTKLNLVGSLLGVILPTTCSPFGIFMMRQYILGLPKSLVESARIDGASEWQIFYNIIVPLCAPMLATLGIFIFLGNWNSFLWPLVILNDPLSFTLPVGLAGLQGKELLDFGIVLSGASLGTIPMLLVFLLFSRWFLKSLTQGAVKE